MKNQTGEKRARQRLSSFGSTFLKREERDRRAELVKAKAELEDIQNQAHPNAAQAQQEVFGCDPKAWPPNQGEAASDGKCCP